MVYNPRTLPLEPTTYDWLRFDKYVGVPWDESIPQTISIIPIERGN